MEWTRMMTGAKAALDDCAAVKPGETVLIVTDTKLTKIAQVLVAATYERGAEPVMTVIKPRDRDGQEPPALVAEAMKHADVILSPVSTSITHTRAVKEAAAAGALGLQLGGDSLYSGKITSKPVLGDSLYTPEPNHILNANRLILAASILCLLFFTTCYLFLQFLF